MLDSYHLCLLILNFAPYDLRLMSQREKILLQNSGPWCLGLGPIIRIPFGFSQMLALCGYMELRKRRASTVCKAAMFCVTSVLVNNSEEKAWLLESPVASKFHL